MRGLKKVLAGIITGALALTMAFGAGNVTAKAAENGGKITVSNTTQDMDYTLYKVFDATYVANSSDKVAYSYDGSNATFLAALKAESSPFTLTPYNGGYNVVKKDVADKVVTDFIKANVGNFGDAVASEKGNGGALTFSNLPYGYYYITSGLGSEVTITSAVPEQTVIDKNQEITIDKMEGVEDAAGKIQWYYEGEGETAQPIIPTQAIGQVVNYKITGTVTQYNGEERITSLTFTDTMSTGLTFNSDSVAVKVNNTVLTKGTDYTVTTDAQTNTTTIVVPTVNGDAFKYPSNAPYEITYTATINASALDQVQNNKVVLKDQNGKDLGTDNTKVTYYSIGLKKVDEDKKALADAHFKLYTTAEGGEEVKVVLVYGTGKADSTVDNVYRLLTAADVANGVKAADDMVTGTTGIIYVKGLKNGDYYFEETQAPAGYNRLEARKGATVFNGNVTPDEFEVENKTGALLPSTGGVGTTIFYIVGGMLIVAGVAYFMLRRKAQAE